MIGFAADDDPERDERAVAAAAGGERDRSGKLERAVDGQRLMGVGGRLDSPPRAGQQQVGEVRI
jgi:hypothetical protein